MAHLKKFSLASKLNKLRDETKKMIPPLLFAQGEDDCLFYSTEFVKNLSEMRKQQIKNVSHTMYELEIPFLSANQLGIEDRYFVMQQQNTNYRWSQLGYQNLPIFQIINPEVISVSQTTNQDWETNICFPFIKSQIVRYDRIKFSYLDLNDEKEIEFEGFNARVVQQALDSLNGFQIIDPRIHCGNWEINPKWKNVLPKTELTIETYKVEIQKLVKSNPECFKMRNVHQLNNDFKEDGDEFSFEAVMMKRLEKYIKREMIQPLMAESVEGDEEMLEKLKEFK